MYNNGGNSWAGYMNNRQSSPYINMLEGYARNYMDPNSPYNMKQFAGLRGEGRSAAGQQFNQGMKMSAAGQNPFANQQYQGAMRSNVDSAMGARNQQTNTNQQLGQGMLGMGMQARATQAGMSQQQQQWDREYKQHETGQWLGLAGTLLSAGIMGPLAAKLTPPTTINTSVDAGPKPVTTAQRMFPKNEQFQDMYDYMGSMGVGFSDIFNDSANNDLLSGRYGTNNVNDFMQYLADNGLVTIDDISENNRDIWQGTFNKDTQQDGVQQGGSGLLGKLLMPQINNFNTAVNNLPQQTSNNAIQQPNIPQTPSNHPNFLSTLERISESELPPIQNVLPGGLLQQPLDRSQRDRFAPATMALDSARAWAKSTGLSNTDNMTLEKAQYWWDKWNPSKKGQYPWGNR